MKKFFFILFILSVVAYFSPLSDDKYLDAIFPHFAIFSLALSFLYAKNLKLTITKLGIPGKFNKNIKYAVAGFFAIILLLIALTGIFRSLNINDYERVPLLVKQFPFYLLVFAILFAPISEELFFRGVLTKHFGVFASSALFGLAHFTYGSTAQVVATFVIGLLLAYIYKKTKSILPSILIHITYNAMSILLIKFVL